MEVTTGAVVVVGLGNRYRRDDGAGVVAAGALRDLALPDVRVVTDIVEPISLLDAWSGADLAVVIDAVVAPASVPGRVSRCAVCDVAAGSEAVSSHRVDVAVAHALGQALDRVPAALTLITIEVADTGHGVGLTPPVAAAVPEVVRMAVEDINRVRHLTEC
ncbi:hydrogenase maturation protease [Mycobacterium simiae]|uniref:Hydrogenase maturation protease n=1 Tax=Mycobacterium simiae TaxID=1784 RepID=A0A5B1BMT8_MYCSI|nr:hydrogenase maturation protease [Mycobacterium simiae]KAA1249165.1 hydrogenase maturation protease [Mycobacterium simiae]